MIGNNYRFNVRGIRADGAGVIWSDEGVVSVVEVSQVRLERLDGAPALDDNPAVPARVDQGQDPSLGRPGGGRRMFAESTTPGGTIHNRVKVVAVISPALPPSPELPPTATTVRVHLRSFDVDDPAPSLPAKDADAALDAVDDNRGEPAAGVLGATVIEIPAGSTVGATELTVSLQPGDNYRVAASTDEAWLASVRARQTVTPEAPVQDGALNVEGPNVSPMLTVWRTLHLEIDSMRPPPQGGPPEEYAQRNFIQGRVLRISVDGPTVSLPPTSTSEDEPDEVIPRYVYVEPETTEPDLTLADGSLMLPEHGGRFQKGTLTIGMGPDAAVVTELDGNGYDNATGWEYVQAITTPPQAWRIDIPVQVKKDTLREVHSRVVAWEHATSIFTLDLPVSAAYVGGTLAAAGFEWVVTGVNGSEVAIDQDGQALEFRLVDDDALLWPFTISTAYVSDSDNPAHNVFAHAYIRPRADLPSEVAPPFIRNVWDALPPTPGDTARRRAQLAAGREWPTMPSFWRSYLQAAVQGNPTRDADPDREDAYTGVTETLTHEHGSFIYAATIRDQLLCTRADQMEHTVAHELGHQFGFDHTSGGLMGVALHPACPHVPDWFTAWQLATIRSKGVEP